MDMNISNPVQLPNNSALVNNISWFLQTTISPKPIQSNGTEDVISEEIKVSKLARFLMTIEGQLTVSACFVLALILFLCFPVAGEVRRVFGGASGNGRSKRRYRTRESAKRRFRSVKAFEGHSSLSPTCV